MSGRKNVNTPYHAVVAGDMSADVTSPPFNIQFQDNVGIQIQWTGTPTGTITIEASLDYIPPSASRTELPNAGNWYALTFNPVLDQPAGSPGGYLVNLNQVPYPWVRVNYDFSSGTGSMDVWTTSKMI